MTSLYIPPSRSRQVLVDSSGFVAVANTNDEHHEEARTIWAYLAQQHVRLYTTNFLIAESHNLFIVRLGHQRARAFLRDIAQSTTTIIRVRASDEQKARDIVSRYTDKDYSLTDGTSFAIMERLGLSLAFTFDHHFEQYGLTVLTPDHFSQR